MLDAPGTFSQDGKIVSIRGQQGRKVPAGSLASAAHYRQRKDGTIE